MVSQDQVASPNGQIFMDGETGTDATSLTGYPSGTQIGIEFKDPGGGESIATFTGAWLATAGAQCLLVDSTVTTWQIHFVGGNVVNCTAATSSNGMIENDSTASGVLIDFIGTKFWQPTGSSLGPYVYNAAGAQPIVLESVRFSANPNGYVSGPWAGHYSDDTGNLVTATTTGIWKATTNGNAVLQAGVAETVVIGGGTTSSNCGVWIGAAWVQPGKMDASSAGCPLSLGSGTYPWADIESQTHTIADPSTTDTAALTVTATGDGNGVNVKLTGNGATAPSKYIRITSGLFQIINSAYSVSLLSLSDTGAGTWSGAQTAPAFEASGSAPTNSGSCATNGQLGGNTAGAFSFNGPCSSGTVNLAFATSAPNGWACHASNISASTPTVLPQSGFTASSAKFYVATAGSGNQVVFGCTAF